MYQDPFCEDSFDSQDLHFKMLIYGKFKFTPTSNEGAKHPKLKNKDCYGEDLRQYNTDRINKINY